MKVEQRRVNSLIPYAKNAKKHSDKQIQNVAKSIRILILCCFRTEKKFIK